jgi:hypothetical protein
MTRYFALMGSDSVFSAVRTVNMGKALVAPHSIVRFASTGFAAAGMGRAVGPVVATSFATSPPIADGSSKWPVALLDHAGNRIPGRPRLSSWSRYRPCL